MWRRGLRQIFAKEKACVMGMSWGYGIKERNGDMMEKEGKDMRCELHIRQDGTGWLTYDSEI